MQKPLLDPGAHPSCLLSPVIVEISHSQRVAEAGGQALPRQDNLGYQAAGAILAQNDHGPLVVGTGGPSHKTQLFCTQETLPRVDGETWVRRSVTMSDFPRARSQVSPLEPQGRESCSPVTTAMSGLFLLTHQGLEILTALLVGHTGCDIDWVAW